ncbi:MAG: hypothetical protein BAJALOKI1v1_1670007 [Promethearchaeota archaeon]|nr:MAG: hypothetical protein BAJALOKI1v1_1670007 [Candidatus Lokiarchaeota archaeon]
MNRNKLQLGSYYTPKGIASYLTKQALLYYLSNCNTIYQNATTFPELIEKYRENLCYLEQKVSALKIVDPACGKGVFLQCALESLLELRKEIIGAKKENKKEFNYHEYKIERDILVNNIYGVDINEDALEHAKQRLLDHITKNSQLDVQIHKTIQCGNSLLNRDLSMAKGFDWNKSFEHIMNKGGFDIIIGNPPWGADLSRIRAHLKREYPLMTKGQFDSYTLFLYMGLRDLLKEKGVVAFVIPNELCFLDQYKSLRKYLLQFQICELINLGFDIFDEVVKPALLLIIKKTRINHPDMSSKSKEHSVFISTGIAEDEKKKLNAHFSTFQEIININSYYRVQENFKQNMGFRFDIFSNNFDRQIISHINAQNFAPLKKYFINGRGIDTNKKGSYFICPKCGYLNPPFGRGQSGRISHKKCNSKQCNFTFKKKKNAVYEKLLLISEEEFPIPGYTAPGYIGEDLHKLHFSRAPRAVRYYGNVYHTSKFKSSFHNYAGIKWGNHELYEGKKLLLRKVSSGHNLQVMIHEGFLVTNQQIYLFKLKSQFARLSLYYFLGILASRLIHYYYLKQFGDPDKKILPHFTQANIKALPIPLPLPLPLSQIPQTPQSPQIPQIPQKNREYTQIIMLSKQLIQKISKYRIEEKNNGLRSNKALFTEIETLYANLDECVFSLYNIEDDTIKKEIIFQTNRNGFVYF